MLQNFKILIYAIIAVLILLPIMNAKEKVSRRSASKVIWNHKKETIRYIGNAKYKEEKNTILSDFMKFYMKKDTGYCTGNVRMYNDDKSVLIRSGRLDYNDREKFAKATKSPILYATNENLTIESEIMHRDFKTDITKAEKNVKIVKENPNSDEKSYGFSEILHYEMDAEIAYLKVNPRLIHRGDLVLGEVIEYHVKTETVDVFGNARVYFGGDESNAQSNYINADRVHFVKDGTTQIVEAYGNVRVFLVENNVITRSEYAYFDMDNNYAILKQNPICHFTDKEMVVESKRIHYHFKSGKDEITFYEDVLIVNNEDETLIESGKLFSDLNNDYTRITEKPICYLENRTVKVVANFFERFEKKDKLYANGNVIVYSKDMKAHGAIGVYNNPKNLMTLWAGNPKLVQGERVIYAKQILFYPKSGKVGFREAEGHID